MKTVLVTGAAGFVGKNLCYTLGNRSDIRVLPYDISDSRETLEDYSTRADVVVHLAGVNRPEKPEDFDKGNRGFTENMLNLIGGSGRTIPLIFASSIQASLDNPYGLSKRAAEEIIWAWSESTGSRAFVYRFPNLFGKWCRPNYNSVVATFCHNIANGLPIRIDNPSSELKLAYIDDVVAEIIAAIDGVGHVDEDGFAYVQRTFSVTLGELASRLHSYAENRSSLRMPDLSTDFDRFLYATYASYLPDPVYPLDMKHDDRGWFAEFMKSSQFGQISISRTKPGITRGNHWHHTKTEKFLVVDGEAVIRMRKVGSRDVIEIPVTGQRLTPVDIPAGFTHAITNTGERDLITLFWASEIFDPSKPDTCYLEV